MAYYRNENGLECLREDDYDNLFVKSTNGRLYLVNKDKEYAERHGLKVVYITDDGQVIIKPNDRQKRRANRKIFKARELEMSKKILIGEGLLQLLSNTDVEEEEKEKEEKV